jgi:hypothetical protein
MVFLEPLELVFIHIPKTGGTSFTEYLRHMYHINLDANALFGAPGETINLHSLQHCTYREIREWLHDRGKDIGDYTILAFIRSPYYRLMSELFYLQRIPPNTKPTEVYRFAKALLEERDPPLLYDTYARYDNHLLSQSEFLIDESGEIPNNLTILESEDIDSIFPLLDTRRLNASFGGKTTPDYYDRWINDDFRQLVQTYYAKDFAMLFDPSGKVKPNIITRLKIFPKSLALCNPSRLVFRRNT